MNPSDQQPAEAPRLGRPALEAIENLAQLEARFVRERQGDSRLALRIISRVSTGGFLLLELLAIVFWYGFNALAPHGWAWDPPPFSLLGPLLATQGVIITTLLLIRTADLGRHDTERAHLALHIALLSERKMTRLIRLATLLLERHGLSKTEIEQEIGEMLQANSVEDAMQEIRAHMPRGC